MMKTTMCGILAAGLAASTGYAQSVHELLGMNVPAAQAPPPPAETGHASAEESPFFVAWTVDPVIAGTTNTKADDSTTTQGFALQGGNIRYDVGVGTSVTFGWRIPDSYLFLQFSAGFTWNGVQSFDADIQIAGNPAGNLSGGSGHLYQVPLLFTPGFEFDLPGGWPFMNGALIRVGPTVGAVYQDLQVDDIRRNAPGGGAEPTYSFGADNWAFAYGAFVDLEFFLSHNISLVLGYQFFATTSMNYGRLVETSTTGAVVTGGDQVKANSTYTNVVKCGLSFYF